MFHVPEEVQELWARKAERLQRLGVTDFPKVPLVTPILSGLQNDPLPVAALQWQIATFPNELPIDVGSAFCEKLDKELFGGHRPSIAGRASCIVATDESLIYVMPDLGQYRRWLWSEIDVEKRRSLGPFSSVTLYAPSADYKISMGSGAAANITYLAEVLGDSDSVDDAESINIDDVTKAFLVRKSNGVISHDEHLIEYLSGCKSLLHGLPCTLAFTDRGVYAVLVSPHQGCDALPIEAVRRSRFENGTLEITTDDGRGVRRQEYFVSESVTPSAISVLSAVHNALQQQVESRPDSPPSEISYMGDQWAVDIAPTHKALFRLEKKAPPTVLELAQAKANPQVAEYVLAKFAVSGGVEPGFADLEQHIQDNLFRRFQAAHAFVMVWLGLAPEIQPLLWEFRDVEQWGWSPPLPATKGSWPGMDPQGS